VLEQAGCVELGEEPGDVAAGDVLVDREPLSQGDDEVGRAVGGGRWAVGGGRCSRGESCAGCVE
jgi:hypothetical protein